MHPLLGNPRRLGLYFAGWIPVSLLLAYLLAVADRRPYGWSLAVAAPLGLLLALICLGIWYPCRVLPLAGGRAPSVLGAQAAAAMIAAALWAGCAGLLGVSALSLVWAFGALLYLLAVAGYYLLLSFEATQTARTLAREAELRALKAQINPHFLFNSLNSISALTSADPARAREMCVRLGDFLRRTLGVGEKPGVALDEELELVAAYLAVEQVRFGDRLRYEPQIAPAAREVTIPPLLLQPLVENAVVHGIAHRLEGGSIRLEATLADDRLRLAVGNPFDADSRRPGTGRGLANVRRRLEARYGPGATLQYGVSEDWFSVVMTLPL